MTATHSKGREILTGIACMLHGFVVTPIAGFMLVSLLAVASEMMGDGFGVSVVISLVLTAVALGVGVAFLASGFGIILRQDWALKVGVPASYTHFGMMTIGAINLARLAATGIFESSPLALLVILILATLWSAAPGLMLKLNFRSSELAVEVPESNTTS